MELLNKPTIELPTGELISPSERTQFDLQVIVDSSFKKFTKNTDPKYAYIDKLDYIDQLRKSVNEINGFEDAYKKIAGEWAYENAFNNSDTVLELNDSELLNQTFDEGFAPLNTIHGTSQSHSDQRKLKYMIYVIVRTVMESGTDDVKWESVK